jgi:fibronectin-binding autotransporter adhesin
MTKHRLETSSHRRAPKLLGGLGLLATASALSLIPASEAQACTIIGSGTLADLNTGDIAVCTGANTGVTIGTTHAGVAVNLQNPGSTLDSSTITLTTSGNEYAQGNSTSSLNTTVSLGASASVLFQSSTIANNLTLSMTDGNFGLFDGAELNVAGGALMFGGASAGISNISIDGELNAMANSQYMITGLEGSQHLFLYGTINGPFDGLLAHMGDGADLIVVDRDATISGGLPGSMIFHGGDGQDGLQLSAGPATMAFDISTSSIESLNVTGSGGTVDITGAHDFTLVQIGNATLRTTSLISLGDPSGAITFNNPNATLELNALGLATHTLGQNLSGGGRVHVTGSSFVELTGTNDAFSGVLEVDAPSYVQLVAGNSAGSASIINNGEVWIEGLTPAPISVLNAISGTGDLDVRHNTFAILGTNNTYSGDTIVRSTATLQIASSASVGTGDIRIEAGAVLLVNDANNGSLLSNLITMGGMLVKDGTGMTDVTNNANSYTGGTLINEGELRVTDLSALGTGPIHVNAAGELVLSNSGTMVVGTLFTGDGSFVKEDSGLLVVNAANTFTGGTFIEAGRVGLNNGDGLGTGEINISSGAVLGIGNIALDNDVSGDGMIIKTASGDAILSGDNTHTGGIDIQDGRIFTSSADSLGTGNINIVGGSALVYTGASSESIANTLSGGGAFRMTGSGQLTFTSAFNLGSLSVESGRVNLNANATTNANVLTGAGLGGTGTIVGNLTNSGTVAPGNSIGTLTVQGNYTHGANAILEIEFDAFGGIDVLNVTGAANIQGGTVRFVSLGGAEGTGGTFLNADGGLTGAFTTIDTVGAAIPITVIYDTDTASMAPTLLSARPSTFNAQILSAADTSFGFVDRISANLAAAPERGAIWAEGFNASADRSGDGVTLGYAHDSSGVSSGVNVRVSEHLTLGAAVGFTNSDIALAEDGGSGSQDGALASIHARYEAGGWSFVGGALVGGIDQETTRNVTFAGLSASIDGQTSSSVAAGFAGIGRDLGEVADWSLRADARATLLRQTQDAYAEDGSSPLRLAVGEVEVDTLEAQAGLTALRAMTFNGRALDLRLGAGVRHLELDGAEIPVAFVLSGAPLTLEGDRRDSSDGYFEAGASYELLPNVTVSAGYAGQAGETERHEARAAVALHF